MSQARNDTLYSRGNRGYERKIDYNTIGKLLGELGYDIPQGGDDPEMYEEFIDNVVASLDEVVRESLYEQKDPTPRVEKEESTYQEPRDRALDRRPRSQRKERKNPEYEAGYDDSYQEPYHTQNKKDNDKKEKKDKKKQPNALEVVDRTSQKNLTGAFGDQAPDKSNNHALSSPVYELALQQLNKKPLGKYDHLPALARVPMYHTKPGLSNANYLIPNHHKPNEYNHRDQMKQVMGKASAAEMMEQKRIAQLGNSKIQFLRLYKNKNDKGCTSNLYKPCMN